MRPRHLVRRGTCPTPYLFQIISSIPITSVEPCVYAALFSLCNPVFYRRFKLFAKELVERYLLRAARVGRQGVSDERGEEGVVSGEVGGNGVEVGG